MRPTPPVLEIAISAFVYSGGTRIALPNFALSSGEIVVLTGRSGSGKSTLIHLLTGVLALGREHGRIRLGDVELAGLDPRARDRLRPNQIGWIPQRVHLIGALSVIDNVLLPISLGVKASSDAHSRARSRAVCLLEAADIGAIANTAAASLSVGQASRACVARALVASPRVLCADEPSAALDRTSAEAIARLFGVYVRDGGAAVVASHDRAFIDALHEQSKSVREIALCLQ